LNIIKGTLQNHQKIQRMNGPEPLFGTYRVLPNLDAGITIAGLFFMGHLFM